MAGTAPSRPALEGLECPRCGQKMSCPHCGNPVERHMHCVACGHDMNLSRGARLELEAGDLTPMVGGWTDVAPLEVRPPHERAAGEEAAITDWDRIAAMDGFKTMIRTKARFVTAATIFFVLYYFALPVSVGYWPQFMDRRVFGVVNLAYLFALSQFFVAWALAWVYVRVANRFDRMSKELIGNLNNGRGGR